MTQHHMPTDTENNDWIGAISILFLIGIGCGFFFLLPNKWTDPIWYSLQYQADWNQVETESKPTECDWGRSPIGGKGCHFKKTVYALNAAGERVGGDDAPQYGQSTTGKPIVSWDNGKTWDWYSESAAPDMRVARVLITWIKVTD